MIKNKTREEVSHQLYVTQSDIKKLFDCSVDTAKRIYTYADEEFDSKEKFRVEPKKVRLTSVCKVTGFSLATLQKQALGTKKVPQQQVL